MEYEQDFVSDELIEIDIDGRKFKYRPTTAGEEASWLNKYMSIENGIIKQDFAKLNDLRLTQIMEVPYSADLIAKIMKFEKPTEWRNLNKEQRVKLLNTLKGDVYDKLLKAMKVDANDDKKKN